MYYAKTETGATLFSWPRENKKSSRLAENYKGHAPVLARYVRQNSDKT